MLLSPESVLVMKKLKADFIFFSSKCLKVLTKQAKIVDLKLNPAQIQVHNQLEKQKLETGKVRALVLKARQQGMSTYIEARFYWLIRFGGGLKAFILTHMQDATDNLFAMTVRYHDNMPEPLKPSTSSANAKELKFDKINGGFAVATAGSKGVGRSSTAQLFHGSEVAFWDNAEMHFAGIGQIVPDAPGTEMILETTGNGTGNLFYGMWQDAVKGLSDYIPIFIAWYVTPEYRREAIDFEATPEESDLARVYGLDNEQLAWRRAKINNDFRGDDRLFKQEYPSNADEAFLVSSDDSLIKPEHALAAFGLKILDDLGAEVWGLDPAEMGDDESVLVKRRGRKHHFTKVWTKKETMELVGLVAEEYAKATIKPVAIFVDAVGLGSGVAGRLKELGLPIIRVMSGERALHDDLYINKRAEMWVYMRDWLVDHPASILADDVLKSQLIAVRYGYDSARRIKLERKEDMKKRGIKSPDRADALALTFAQTVIVKREKKETRRAYNWKAGG